MHDHKECEHELKYCSKCDTVYCEICCKEWRTPFNYSVWYNKTITNDAIGLDKPVVTLHAHA